MSRKLMINNIIDNQHSAVRNGLVCWLDAIDMKMGGNIWVDRSGNNKNAILSDSSGVFNNNTFKFKGYGNIENPTLNLSEYTVEVCLTDLNAGYWNGLFGNDFWGTGYSLYLTNTGFGINPPELKFDNTLSYLKKNIIITVIYKNNSWRIYINGVFQTQPNVVIKNSTASYFVICGRKPNSPTQDSTGAADYKLNNWNSFKIYNCALTQEEITQNYNYEKSITRG